MLHTCCSKGERASGCRVRDATHTRWTELVCWQYLRRYQSAVWRTYLRGHILLWCSSDCQLVPYLSTLSCEQLIYSRSSAGNTHANRPADMTNTAGMTATRDVQKPNFCLVSVFKNPNRTEAKMSNLKFRFPWLFSKPNLSHTNSQYLSHSHKALTYLTLQNKTVAWLASYTIWFKLKFKLNFF